MKRIIAISAAVLCLLVYIPVSAADYKGSEELLSVANGIISWKRLDNGAEDGGSFFNDKFLSLAGTTPGDWYPIGMSRLEVPEDYSRYLAVLKAEVEKRYKEKNKLSAAKATEWHRISLAVLAAGGDPTHFGTDKDGNPINLIADGTYNRGKTASLGRQGINGWIWGLIALDSLRYEIPEGSFYSRDDIITEILCQQLSDGGFALSGKTSDPDITAMAVQALSPYYTSKKVYKYTLKSSKQEISRTVKQVIDESLFCLSRLQTEDGDFISWGTQNAESTAQAAVALCSLNIDPQKDARFIKNGKTLIDGILKYRMPDGGFAHSYTYDPDNPSSKPDKSNSMAGEQVLYALAAVIRQQKGQSALYDFRKSAPEAPTEPKNNDNTPESKSGGTSSGKPQAPKDTQSSQSSAVAENTKPESTEETQEDTPVLYFAPSDRKAVDSLPARLTTEQYYTVIALLEKLKQSDDFEGKENYLKKLTAAKEEIEKIQKEIDSLNADILKKLYPFDKISLKDKKAVDSIVRRYNALSDYDKTKIENREDIIKTRTKIYNRLRAYIIAAVSVAVILALGTLVIIRIRRRKNRKKREMEELAAMYGEDE